MISFIILVILQILQTQFVNSDSNITNITKEIEVNDERRIYDFRKVGGAGCPYTASWLANINLYRRIVW